MKRIGIAIVCAAVMAAVSALPASAADLPSPEKIFTKHVEATGGAAAYAKVKNQVTTATFALPDMGMEGVMVTTVAVPNNRSTITLDVGVIDNGVTDGVAWSVNPMEGSKILEGDESALAIANAASISPFLDFKGEAETVGEEKVGDEDCYKVEIAGAGASYFSKESGLLLQSSTPLGLATLSEYKEVNGVKIAHKTNVAGDQFAFEITVNSVEQNVDLDESTFVVPDEIKALMPTETAGVTAKQVMGMMDTDSDGKITLEEAPEQLKAAFAMVDANADGAIDEEEAQTIAEFMNNQ